MKNQSAKSKASPHLDMTIRVTLSRKLFKRMAEYKGKVWKYKHGEQEPEDFYDYVADDIEAKAPTDSRMRHDILCVAMFTGSAEIVKVSPIKGKRKPQTP